MRHSKNVWVLLTGVFAPGVTCSSCLWWLCKQEAISFNPAPSCLWQWRHVLGHLSHDQCMTPECSKIVLFSKITCTFLRVILLEGMVGIHLSNPSMSWHPTRSYYSAESRSATMSIMPKPAPSSRGPLERWKKGGRASSSRPWRSTLHLFLPFLPAVLHSSTSAWELSVQEAWKDNVDQVPLAVEVSGAAMRKKLAGRISAAIHQLLDRDYL